MNRQWLWGPIFASLLFLQAGCHPGDRVLLDDSKNPNVAAGLTRVSSYQYDAAIENFEKALLSNPRSVRAHYELGLIYEKQKRDFVTAIYHYQRVLKYQDRGWPAENARLLIDGCRQELIKAEALAPVAQAMQQELDKLKSDNTQLKEQLAALKGDAGTATSPGAASAAQARRTTSTSQPDLSKIASTTSTQSALAIRGTSMRTHQVKPGETLASIGRSYQVTLSDMLTANPSIKPRSLAVGTVINIPAR